MTRRPEDAYRRAVTAAHAARCQAPASRGWAIPVEETRLPGGLILAWLACEGCGHHSAWMVDTATLARRRQEDDR